MIRNRPLASFENARIADGDGAGRRGQAKRGLWRQAPGGDERRDRRDQQRRLPAERLQEQRHHARAERRAGEVGEVERPGGLAPQVEHHRQRHAREQERDEGRDEVEREPFGREREPDDQRQAERDRNRVQQREHPGAFDRRRHAAFEEVEHEAAEAPAEQGHGDDHEREVVPDRRRVDSSETNLEDQPGECDEKNREMDVHAPRQLSAGGRFRSNRGLAW